MVSGPDRFHWPGMDSGYQQTLPGRIGTEDASAEHSEDVPLRLLGSFRSVLAFGSVWQRDPGSQIQQL